MSKHTGANRLQFFIVYFTPWYFYSKIEYPTIT